MRNRQANYLITAHPTPPALPQILQQVAMGGHVPTRVRSRTLGGRLQVEIDVASLTDDEAALLAAQLRALPTTTQVRLEQMEWGNAA